MADYSLGQVVTLSDGRHGYIRFVGDTHFAAGDWIGVELDEATGKNDGAVQGERYFDCEPGYGMFVRPSVIVAVADPPPRETKPPPKSSGIGIGARGRPSSIASGPTGAKRQSTLSTSSIKRNSVNAVSPSPTPKAPTPRALRSPTKSPTKQLSTGSASSSARMSLSGRPSMTAAKPRPSVGARTSMGPPAPPSTTSKLSRPSLTGPPGKITRSAPQIGTSTPNGLTRRSSIRPASQKIPEELDKGTSAQFDQPNSAERLDNDGATGPITPNASKSGPRTLQTTVTRADLSPGMSPSGSRQSQSAAVARELDELKTKLKVMEKKRAEDREKLKMLEKLQMERDKFEAIIQKLQAKYQPQQLEIGDLRKALKDSESRLEEVERLQAEHESLLEMAALDREMAEETAEAYKHECETLRLKVEELQLEADVLKEENEEMGQVMSPEEKSSQGWLQMEKTNERLREALIRLRDMTQQQEAGLRDQIKELEEDLEDYAAVKSQYESTKERLLVSENNVEDLKQQLETALGAEEMIEELADKNMRYQEEINELKAAIEDLEALKEISDELEITHLETEKQLQEEIDYRDTLFGEQSRRIAQQDEVIDDLEYTLSRFRELVSTLQTDLEDMRASQQISEAESTELTSRSRAMMDLNMKLQASVSKAQTKSIEIELGRMEAEEAAQHLSIVKLYLPEYFDTERNSILTLLRFKRVGFKASMMHNAIRERVSEQAAISTAQEEIFTSMDVLEKLQWISSICDRFQTFIGSCPPETFLKIEGALFELEPVERTLNSWIETLKKNDMNMRKCAVELQRSIALLSHLAETQLPSTLESLAEELYMDSVLTQSYLDHSASSISRVKALMQSKLAAATEEDGEKTFLFNKMDAFVSQARGYKVAVGKISRALDDLKARSLALPRDAVEPFTQTEEAARELSELTRQTGENLVTLFGEEGRTDPFTLGEVQKNMWQAVFTVLQSSESEVEGDDAMGLLAKRLRALGSRFEELESLSSDLSTATEFERLSAPWVARAEELRSNKTISPDADEEIRRLKNELHEASTAMGVKDKTLEEQGIKIELLESRMREANKKASMVKELESKIEGMQAREGEFQATIEQQKKDLQVLETEREEYRARFEKIKRVSGSAGIGATADGVVVDAGASFAMLRENESLRTEVASLQSAVRFLRDEVRRSKQLDPYSAQRNVNLYSWLDVPLTSSRTRDPEREKIQQTALESREIFNHLVKLTAESQLCDLRSALGTGSTRTQQKDNRTGWRPSKTKLRHQVLQQRENLERWTEWRNDIVQYEREQDRLAAAKREKVARERAQRHSRFASEADFPQGLGHGMMSRAWQILGMQQDDDRKVGGSRNAPGVVDIVSQD